MRRRRILQRWYDRTEAAFKRHWYIAHYNAAQMRMNYGRLQPKTHFWQLCQSWSPITFFPHRRAKKLANSITKARHSHNRKFIDAELVRTKTFFDNIDGRSLDKQQRVSAITNEDNVLVIAGAGSGKTTTLVAKVAYLTKRLRVKPDQILAVSFTRKSARELEDRLSNAAAYVHTFHKFGLDILSEATGARPDVLPDGKTSQLFRSFLKELEADRKFVESLGSWLALYQKIPVSQFDFESLEEYSQYLQDHGFHSYKRVKIPHEGRVTYAKEKVKSVEECMIANFLLFNRVKYSYEQPYPRRGGPRYLPDFTIHTDKQEIYLEHFGINRSGNVPPFFARPGESAAEASRRYRSDIEKKRLLHNMHRTTLIETYSYEFDDRSLISNLRVKLAKAGVELKPMTAIEVWDIIRKSAPDEIDAFVDLCTTFLALQKSNDVPVKKLRQQAQREKHGFERTRTLKFLQLYDRLRSLYEDYLKEHSLIDFADMVNNAAAFVRAKRVVRKFDYALVDEFQDLSVGRYRLLQALKQQNPAAKFFCVGDDWQSIYRFTGSDLGLFHKFERYFGYTEKLKIETTYRFSEPMIGASGGFVMKNPAQTKKQLRPAVASKKATYSVVDSSQFDDTEAVIKIFRSLETARMPNETSVLMLGRYNNDVNRIKSGGGLSTSPRGSIEYRSATGPAHYSAHFSTVHAAKGLEADVVIVLNASAFPAEHADDPLLRLVLSKEDAHKHGEERRVFYVAMTRAKRKTFFVTSAERKSVFIKEMQSQTAKD